MNHWRIATLASLLLAGNFANPMSAAEAFRDCPECPPMVRIPPPPGAPQAFAIGQYEVTQREWFAIMGDRPSEFVGDDLPVETVSWRDVQTFLEKLSAKAGQAYRLPTSTEWEHAARAGSTTKYPFGDDPAALGDHAWFLDNAGEETHPVGQKRPNAFGLYDTLGNVWEWTSDCAAMDGAPRNDETVAKFIRDCHRIYRGGSMANKASSLALGFTQSSGTGDRYFAMGLRVVRSLPH